MSSSGWATAFGGSFVPLTVKTCHSTPPPAYGLIFKLPKNATTHYAFSLIASDNQELSGNNAYSIDSQSHYMSGFDFISQYFLGYQYFQGYQGLYRELQRIDGEYLIDAEHLTMLEDIKKTSGEELTAIRRKHHPLPEKQFMECGVQFPPTGSRLYGVVFDGQLLRMSNHHGTNNKGEAVYSGPELPADFWVTKPEYNEGFVVANDEKSKMESLYRKYTAIVIKIDRMKLNDKNFGDLLKVP